MANPTKGDQAHGEDGEHGHGVGRYIAVWLALMGFTALSVITGHRDRGAINLPLSLAPRLATALHATWMPGVATAVASVAGLGGVAAAARLGWSLPAFVAMGCIRPLCANAATCVLLLRS